MNSINLNNLFSTEIGKKIYFEAQRAINDFSMDKMISDGVLVGFSGGADSVMLLCLLAKYRENHDINICAVHINHMIRGEDANRDEAFSREFCQMLNIEFLSYSCDVPTAAKEQSKGLEEVARNIRYSKFNDILRGRKDVSCIAVAHNATDNLETVIFNMMRGSGAKGICGISALRDNIIRPLIYVPKRDITRALNIASVPFVTDNTNFDIDYKRNYIRNEILPKLFELTANPEFQAERLCSSLRADNDFIESCAQEFIKQNCSEKGILTQELAKLPMAVFSRVIINLQKEACGCSPERTHIDKIRNLIFSKGRESFSVSMPGNLSFVSEGGVCSIKYKPAEEPPKFFVQLNHGINNLPNSDNVILISDEPLNKFSSNVYKISIQQTVDSAIINGRLYAREKHDGDSYVYGGMTHKLKKIFNDKKLSPEERKKIPIICDKNGILFVPGFPVRDGGSKNATKKLYIALLNKV